MYKEVLGASPAAALFMSSEARGNITPETLQARLQRLVSLIGSAQVTHRAIKSYPQLVALLPETAANNFDQLKGLLGATREEMQRVVTRSARWAPHRMG